MAEFMERMENRVSSTALARTSARDPLFNYQEQPISPSHAMRNEIDSGQALDFWNQNGQDE
jgi:hypothetical protein